MCGEWLALLVCDGVVRPGVRPEQPHRPELLAENSRLKPMRTGILQYTRGKLEPQAAIDE
ncbi:MAG TPA: hypothetical protein DEG76_08175 [Pseudohongiella sp.]|nr:hypothetical protein [Pseudohongiella sp.]